MSIKSYFNRFTSPIEGIPLPEKFDYPFYYVPHPLAVLASKELQHYLETQKDWEHNFGLIEGQAGINIGKMFGVLVVKNEAGELGYICAVSGKLAGHNQHEKFVPPVFDILLEDGFYRKGEAIVSEINARIEKLENESDFIALKQEYKDALKKSEEELRLLKANNKTQREVRHLKRKELERSFSGVDLEEQLKMLDKQSIHESYQQKKLSKFWKEKIAELESAMAQHKEEVEALKEERKTRSAALQAEIFEQFYFYNRKLEQKSLGEIFKNTPDGKPIAGSGECAAPKLFQYAFSNKLEPIAMAEFWWGESPPSEIRVHGNYYPACRGKCEPILGHMLSGMELAENPMLKNPAEGKELRIFWEDDYIVVIDKPDEFLSVPGKNISDSVATRLRFLFPRATGPLVVHRLDMSTSGLLLAAKTEEVYKSLQRQFLKREVKKRYVALLDGELKMDEGIINLPLRLDLEDRPRQMVCYEYGKPALTRFEVVERKDGKTRIHFYPITGRTHQLRMHAAHPQGLNMPIIGDDLYGKKGERLFLHAEYLEFTHPITREIIKLELKAGF
ncbi:MAG: pseudouridine synthase [Flavobacteriales bacterium]|jgi:tRNA pseudouridine32 synthase/23S rRNA pseudouridine746 synthase